MDAPHKTGTAANGWKPQESLSPQSACRVGAQRFRHRASHCPSHSAAAENSGTTCPLPHHSRSTFALLAASRVAERRAKLYQSLVAAFLSGPYLFPLVRFAREECGDNKAVSLTGFFVNHC